MVTKKEVKKPVKKVKNVTVIIDDIKPEKKEYVPVFPTVTISSTQRIDANYLSIKRKLKSIGIDLFSKIKKEEIKKEPSKITVSFYSIIYEKIKDNKLWQKYCKWFNKKFNGVE